MIPGIVAGGGLATPVVGPTVTWNPADRSASIVLSGGDLVAAHAGAGVYQSVRATHPLLPGRCCEFYVAQAGTSPFCVVGVSGLAESLDNYAGHSPNGFTYYQQTGNKFNSGDAGAYGPAWGSSDRIGMARIGNDLYFWRNGVALGVAFTLPGDVDFFPVASLYREAHTIGLRARASNMSQTYGGCAPMGS